MNIDAFFQIYSEAWNRMSFFVEMSPLESERLLLRPLHLDDAEMIAALLQDPVIAHWTLRLPWPYTVDDARWFIAHQAENEAAGVALNWAIVERVSGLLVGVIGLHAIESVLKCGELGYWMGEQYRGRGYMTEAARRIVGWAFEIAGFERIQATYFIGNDASAHVLNKVGMTEEGILRGFALKNDRYLDVHLAAVLRDDSTWMSVAEQERSNAP